MTASATAPPAPHNKLSRLPWIHRVSLELHTNREYAQKQKTVTTHFFRFFLGGLSKFYREVRVVRLTTRNCVGDLPDNLLKTRLNCESD